MSAVAKEVVSRVLGMSQPDYAERFLKIRTKSKGIQPLRYNSAQLYLHRKAEIQLAAKGYIRLSLLKARQWGGSTYVQSRFYSKIARGSSGVRAFILTHQEQATNNIFTMTKRFHDNLDRRIRPTSPRPSAKKLEFPRLDSSYAVATAGSKAVGRSDTIQLFHGSEVAFWPNDQDHMTGALQAVPAQGPGSEVFLESTGNGQGNAFYWNFMNALAGLSEYVPVFVPWFWMDEYRAPLDGTMSLDGEDESYMQLWGLDLEQMQFRHNKIMDFGGGDAGRAKFQQEYPCTPQEAFSQNIAGGYIEAKYVLMARNMQQHMVSVFGPKIMGIDPAYTGDDRFIVFMRQGRLAVRVGRWQKLRKPQSMGRMIRLLHEYRPDIVCIDAGGVGGPFYDDLVPICDRLGIQIIPVLGGEQADDPERYPRKRVENAARCREWFEDANVPCLVDLAPPPADSGIDGLDEIQADITAPLCDWDTAGRPIIETKKRILTHAVSPDNLEALMNTFSLLLPADWKPRESSESNSLAHARRPINWRAV